MNENLNILISTLLRWFLTFTSKNVLELKYVAISWIQISIHLFPNMVSLRFLDLDEICSRYNFIKLDPYSKKLP